MYRNSKCTLKQYANQTYDRILGPIVDTDNKKPIYKHCALDNDGIASPGEMVKERQVSVLNTLFSVSCHLMLNANPLR